MEQQRRTIMVDLDTLLDTRLALLFYLDNEAGTLKGFTTALRKEYTALLTNG